MTSILYPLIVKLTSTSLKCLIPVWVQSSWALLPTMTTHPCPRHRLKPTSSIANWATSCYSYGYWAAVGGCTSDSYCGTSYISEETPKLWPFFFFTKHLQTRWIWWMFAIKLLFRYCCNYCYITVLLYFCYLQGWCFLTGEKLLFADVAVKVPCSRNSCFSFIKAQTMTSH